MIHLKAVTIVHILTIFNLVRQIGTREGLEHYVSIFSQHLGKISSSLFSLSRRLNVYGLREVKVSGDGNCQVYVMLT